MNIREKIIAHLQTFPGITDEEMDQAVEAADRVADRFADQDTFVLSERGRQTLREFGYDE